MTTKSALSLGLAAGLVLPLAGCRSDAPAWGEANAIIVVAVDSIWRQVGDSVLRALEPRFPTVREERSFNVTRVSPLDTSWVTLRRFKQVLSLGVAGDSWVAPAVADPARAAPYIEEREDVWARGQRLTAVVLSPTGSAAEVHSLLPELGERLDSLYRAYVTGRMYQSGISEPMRDSVAAQAGFSLALPALYRPERHDSLWVFRNWTMMGGELRRTIAVTWRAGLDTTTSNELVFAWRDSMVATYQRPQAILPEPVVRRRVGLGELTAFEVQGAWAASYDGVPMGGPFITRVIPCPTLGRTYVVDAWLYAPSREKYEYMIQLETLLNTFACGAYPAPAANR